METATSDAHLAFTCQIEHRYRAQGMEKNYNNVTYNKITSI